MSEMLKRWQSQNAVDTHDWSVMVCCKVGHQDTKHLLVYIFVLWWGFVQLPRDEIVLAKALSIEERRRRNSVRVFPPNLCQTLCLASISLQLEGSEVWQPCLPLLEDSRGIVQPIWTISWNKWKDVQHSQSHESRKVGNETWCINHIHHESGV